MTKQTTDQTQIDLPADILIKARGRARSLGMTLSDLGVSSILTVTRQIMTPILQVSSTIAATQFLSYCVRVNRVQHSDF